MMQIQKIPMKIQMKNLMKKIIYQKKMKNQLKLLQHLQKEQIKEMQQILEQQKKKNLNLDQI